MAKIGDTPSANRYDGLPLGPHVAYTFETQEGVPVDAGSGILRDVSPFTIRILPPDVLFAMAEAAALSEQGATTASVDLIRTAASSADTNERKKTLEAALSRVTLIDTSASKLQAAVADGRFLTDQNSEYLSTIVDVSTVADIALQLQTILNAPPLTLLVNPNDMSINYTKVQTHQSRTRSGYVFEAWGEDKPQISFSGSTGGFYAGAQSPTLQSTSGLQYAAKRDSAAWQNFMSLFTFYKNNGYIYDTVGKSYAHLFIGALAIDYDQWTYVGHLDSFSYTYDENMPHRVEFDMEFAVSKMYDWALAPAAVLPQIAPTASSSDPRYNGSRRGASGTRGLFTLNTQTAATALQDVAEFPLDLVGLDARNFGSE